MSGSGSAPVIYFGGVSLAVDLTCVEFLCFEMSLYFVAGVLHIWRLSDFVVVAVYIPPHESINAPSKYCAVLDLISEMVGYLQL